MGAQRRVLALVWLFKRVGARAQDPKTVELLKSGLTFVDRLCVKSGRRKFIGVVGPFTAGGSRAIREAR